MRRHKLWSVGGVLLAVGVMMFANAGSAAENEKSGNANAAASHDDDDVEHHAALGVSLAETEKGVRIVAVLPGSPAARAGLQPGDEIRFVGDERVRSSKNLREEISAYRPGAQVELTIRRNGERQTVKAKLAAQSSVYGARARAQRSASGGVSNEELAQQVRALQQEVIRLRQSMNQYQPPSVWRGGREWNSLQRHGEADDDPALFQ